MARFRSLLLAALISLLMFAACSTVPAATLPASTAPASTATRLVSPPTVASTSTAALTPTPTAALVPITQVVDGDTIKVPTGGRTESVRVIGIDTERAQ